MNDNILEIESVTKNYGKQTVLRDVSFSISPGKITGILGPNGSGKTTLIKIINGLIADYSGSVKIGGQHPGIDSKKIVSYLPDSNDLPGWLRVKDAVNLFDEFFDDFNSSRAHVLLNTLSVPENKLISQLSKGMCEKLRLTLCMSRSAKLYVLDEPIAGVDPAAREVILNTIMTNFDENSSLLISTHIISDIEQIFDDVIFLKDGTVYLSGNAESLRLQHENSIDGLFREVYRC